MKKIHTQEAPPINAKIAYLINSFKEILKIMISKLLSVLLLSGEMKVIDSFLRNHRGCERQANWNAYRLIRIDQDTLSLFKCNKNKKYQNDQSKKMCF